MRLLDQSDDRGWKNLATSPLILSCVLFLFVLLVYLPTLWFQFVWDDKTAVVLNPAIRSASQIPSYFTDSNTFGYNPSRKGLTAWRPLRNISYLLDYKLNGLNPAGFHFHNILLHAIITVLLFHFFRRCLALRWPIRSKRILTAAWVSAALWAVHPVQTEVVAWIKSRDDLLVDLFILASLYCSLNAIFERNKVIYFSILSTVFLIFAGLSKDNGVLIPGFLLFFPLLARDSGKLLKSRRFLVLLAIQTVISMSIIAIRDHVVGRISQSGYLTGSFYSMMLTMIPAYVRYAQVIIWPFPPTRLWSDYYAYPMEFSIISIRLWTSIILLTAIVLAAIFLCRHKRPAWYGLLFFLIAMFPYTNLIPMVQVLAERFLNLALMGIFLILASWVISIRSRKYRILALAISFGLLTAYCMANLVRQQTWRNDLTLAKEIYEVNPSLRTTQHFAEALFDSGQTTESIKIISVALKYYPEVSSAKVLLGKALLKAGCEEEGLQKLKIVVEAHPDMEDPVSLLAAFYFNKKDFKAAKTYATMLTVAQPDFAGGWYNLAMVDLQLGDKRGALKAAHNCENLDPLNEGLQGLLKAIEGLPDNPDKKSNG